MPADYRFMALNNAGGRLRVLSALNPGLWLCGLTIAGYTAASAVSSCPTWPLTSVMIASVLATIAVFVNFAIHDPDRLQSEDYQLKKQSLMIINEKGTKHQTADAANRVLESAIPFPKDGGTA